MRDPRTEGTLNSLGVTFEYWDQYPLSKLVSDEATQVRFPANLQQPAEVKRYYDLLVAGAEFPPVVVLKDGRLVDGNTRWGAYAKRKLELIPAYVCDTSSVLIAKRIGVELNSLHGKRMERKELSAWLASGNGSVTDEEARRLTGWNAKTVRETRGALAFEARRTKLSVPLDVHLPDGTRYRLQQVADPQVFADLTALAADAGPALEGSALTKVVKDLNETALTSVPDARAKVAALRTDLGQAIQERAAGLRIMSPLLRQLQLHLGWAVNQGASGLHDTNPQTADRSRRLLEAACEVIQDALSRYQGT